eukprot:329815-Chlamydomonas_euryale.AAC.1
MARRAWADVGRGVCELLTELAASSFRRVTSCNGSEHCGCGEQHVRWWWHEERGARAGSLHLSKLAGPRDDRPAASPPSLKAGRPQC